uniref:Chromo domain-containing protein n=1 Tax=Clytia hemisphaerica TaxID=252671 RepID=A0A7M6DPT4_9CNID
LVRGGKHAKRAKNCNCYSAPVNGQNDVDVSVGTDGTEILTGSSGASSSDIISNENCIVESSLEHLSEELVPPNPEKILAPSDSIETNNSSHKRSSRAAKLDILYEDLNDDDLIPNSRTLNVTKREVLHMAEQNEGFIENVESFRFSKAGKKEFMIKWIGYKKPTWEPEQLIPNKIISNYFASLIP